MRPYERRATWELNQIKKALSLHPWLNTEEEKKRLEDVTLDLRLRRKKK